jgi:uncharacterized protein
VDVGFAALSSLDLDRGQGLRSGAGLYASFGWLSLVEALGAERPRYVVASERGAPVGVLPVYGGVGKGSRYDVFSSVVEPLLDGRATASDWSPSVLLGGRAGYASGIPVAPGLDEREAASVRQELLRAAVGAAASEGAAAAAMLYVAPEDVGRVVEAAPAGSVAVLTEARAVLEVRWSSFEEYCTWLTWSRRRHVRREERRLEAAGCELARESLDDRLIDAAAPLAANLEAQYGGRPDTQAERRYLEQIARHLGDRSHVFTCRRDSDLLGFALCIEHDGVLHSRNAGFLYPEARRAAAYFHVVVYEPLRFAIERGLHALDLGIGSREAKLLRGGALEPLWSLVVPLRHEPDDLVRRARRYNAVRRATWLEQARKLQLGPEHPAWTIGS